MPNCDRIWIIRLLKQGNSTKAKAAAEEIERLQSQIRPAADPEAIAYCRVRSLPLSKGSYATNNATGLKKLVEQVLKLLAGG